MNPSNTEQDGDPVRHPLAQEGKAKAAPAPAPDWVSIGSLAVIIICLLGIAGIVWIHLDG